MDDSRRPSKWQDDAVQAADTHRGLAARGRETEEEAAKARGKNGARGPAAQKKSCTCQVLASGQLRLS